MPHSAAPTPEDAFALLEALERTVARLPDDDLHRLDAALRLEPAAAAVWQAARQPATLNELKTRTNELRTAAGLPTLGAFAFGQHLTDLQNRGWIDRRTVAAPSVPTITLEAGSALGSTDGMSIQYVAAPPPEDD